MFFRSRVERLGFLRKPSPPKKKMTGSWWNLREGEQLGHFKYFYMPSCCCHNIMYPFWTWMITYFDTYRIQLVRIIPHVGDLRKAHSIRFSVNWHGYSTQFISKWDKKNMTVQYQCYAVYQRDPKDIIMCSLYLHLIKLHFRAVHIRLCGRPKLETADKPVVDHCGRPKRIGKHITCHSKIAPLFQLDFTFWHFFENCSHRIFHHQPFIWGSRRSVRR